MLQIKCGKPEKRKGAVLPPLPMPRAGKKGEESSGASTSFKEVQKKHDSVRKANINAKKDT